MISRSSELFHDHRCEAQRCEGRGDGRRTPSVLRLLAPSLAATRLQPVGTPVAAGALVRLEVLGDPCTPPRTYSRRIPRRWSVSQPVAGGRGIRIVTASTHSQRPAAHGQQPAGGCARQGCRRREAGLQAKHSHSPFSAIVFLWCASSAGKAFMCEGKSGRWQSTMLASAMSAIEMPDLQ